jgi:hypothetical protein
MMLMQARREMSISTKANHMVLRPHTFKGEII